MIAETKSILENRPLLALEINKVAEVAGYLWQKGWAERNGGNITVNITDFVDDEIRNRPPLSEPIPIGKEVPHLKGCYFYCKGTNKRMRDLARRPMENGSVIRVSEDGCGYVIIADRTVKPTSELPTHLGMHNYLVEQGSAYKAVLHTHPTELIAMTHHGPFLGRELLTTLLWSMIPETRLFCPGGIGLVPYALPGSLALAEATIKELKDHPAILWEKHGICAVGTDIMDAFDQVDVFNKSAQIYMAARSMGFAPEGIEPHHLQEMKEAYGL